ncbi:hypothetical protein C8J57DRAFT_1229258 [Mycena rebaudengoi]|nr:hypothetical protein C8J57DRAFT_1229258 [Mycena rebaudengoi]
MCAVEEHLEQQRSMDTLPVKTPFESILSEEIFCPPALPRFFHPQATKIPAWVRGKICPPKGWLMKKEEGLVLATKGSAPHAAAANVQWRHQHHQSPHNFLAEALTAAGGRSRMHLFAAIFCQRLSDFSHVDHLLAESPHIGEFYVRYFNMTIRSYVAPLLAEDVILPRILSRLPSLTHVTLDCLSTYGVWPSLFKASIRTTLSLHCLRSLCFCNLGFANVSEFELLLSHTTGLKALTLGNIHFENPSASVRGIDLPEVRVVLESLELELGMEEVDAMSSFSTVGIKHLKSLVTNSFPIIPLLKVNAQTIQKVRISASHYPVEPPDPDILKGNQTLHLIEITEDSSGMASALQQFGHHGHLKALKTISLDFIGNAEDASSNTAGWTKLDAILSPAVEWLEDIHIHIEQPLDLGLIRSLLPSVGGGEIAVHVHRKLPSRASEEL